MERDKSFLGTGWSFPPRFNPLDRGVDMVSADEDIKQSLNIILSTAPGERLMRPSFGCGLKKMVFERINESTRTQIKDLVERAVLFFEPRITLLRVEVDAAEVHEGKVLISLEYVIRTTNMRSNMVYPFYFREGTNIRP